MVVALHLIGLLLWGEMIYLKAERTFQVIL